MSLKISVLKNHLPTGKSPYIVHSDSSDLVEFDRFVDLMAKGRTTLTKTDILAAMQLYKEELQRLLAEGRTVKTPTGSFYICASGCMDSQDESFLPGAQDRNHELRIHHRPEKDFEAAVMADLLLVREERFDQVSPSIQSLVSSSTKRNDETRAGDIIKIRGLRLRFAVDNPEEGVFFVAASGASVRSGLYPMVQPGTVIAVVPGELAAGTYALVIRTRPNGKDLRKGSREGLVVIAG